MTISVAWHPVSNIAAGELKNWMLRHVKKPSVGVELRASGGPNRCEKLGWNASDTG